MKLKNWVILLCAASICFSACSHEEKQKPDQEKNINIRVSYYTETDTDEKMREIIDGFMKANPGIKVEPTSLDWFGHYSKLKPELAAGEGPDVFILDGVYIQEYAANDRIQDITEYFKDTDLELFYGIDEAVNSDGRLYGIPQSVQADVLYYNKDMFDAANLKYPTADWSLLDMVEAAKKLTGDGKWGLSLPIHVRSGYYPIIRKFGGDILDPTRQKSTIASDPKVKIAMQFIYDCWNTWKIVPVFSDMTEENTNMYNYFFADGRAAMYFDNYSLTTHCNNANFRYDVQVQPYGPDGIKYNSFIANCWVINKHIEDEKKNAGAQFMKYYLGEAAQSKVANMPGILPASKKACQEIWLNIPGQPENKLAFIESLQVAQTLGDNAVWSAWKNAFNKVLIQYLKDEITLDEAILIADRDVQAVLDEFYKNR